MQTAQEKAWTPTPEHQVRVSNIRKHRIPVATLAELSGSQVSQVSDFSNYPGTLSADRREAIGQVVDRVSEMVEAMEAVSASLGLAFAFDLRDANTVRAVLERVKVERERKAIAQDETFDTILASIPDPEMQMLVHALINKCAEQNIALVINLNGSSLFSTIGYATKEILRSMNDAWQETLNRPVTRDYFDQRAESSDLASVTTAKK